MDLLLSTLRSIRAHALRFGLTSLDPNTLAAAKMSMVSSVALLQGNSINQSR